MVNYFELLPPLIELWILSECVGILLVSLWVNGECMEIIVCVCKGFVSLSTIIEQKSLFLSSFLFSKSLFCLFYFLFTFQEFISFLCALSFTSASYVSPLLVRFVSANSICWLLLFAFITVNISYIFVALSLSFSTLSTYICTYVWNVGTALRFVLILFS